MVFGIQDGMMLSMKRGLSALFLSVLLLTACGGSGKTAAVTCKEQFWNGTVAVCLPAGWSVMDKETLADRGVPDEVVVAFQSAKTQSGQFPTVTVTKEALTEQLSSSDYSEASVKSVSTLPGYTLVDSKKVTVDASSVDEHIFTAQPLNDEPARRFYQVSAVSGGNGYTVTGLAPVSVTSSLDDEIKLIITSLSFKQPDGTASSK